MKVWQNLTLLLATAILLITVEGNLIQGKALSKVEEVAATTAPATLPYDDCKKHTVTCVGGPGLNCTNDKSCKYLSTYEVVLNAQSVDTVHVKVAAVLNPDWIPKGTDFFIATGLSKINGMGPAALTVCTYYNGKAQVFKAYNSYSVFSSNYYVDGEFKDDSVLERNFNANGNILTCSVTRDKTYTYVNKDIFEDDFILLDNSYYPIFFYGIPIDGKGHLMEPPYKSKATITPPITLRGNGAVGTLPYDDCKDGSVFCIGGPDTACLSSKTCEFMATYQVVKMTKKDMDMNMVHVKLAAILNDTVLGTTDENFYVATGLSRNSDMSEAAVTVCTHFGGKVQAFPGYNGKKDSKNHYYVDKEIKGDDLMGHTYVDNVLTCYVMRGDTYDYDKDGVKDHFPLLNTDYYSILAYGIPIDNKGNLNHHVQFAKNSTKIKLNAGTTIFQHSITIPIISMALLAIKLF